MQPKQGCINLNLNYFSLVDRFTRGPAKCHEVDPTQDQGVEVAHQRERKIR